MAARYWASFRSQAARRSASSAWCLAGVGVRGPQCFDRLRKLRWPEGCEQPVFDLVGEGCFLQVDDPGVVDLVDQRVFLGEPAPVVELAEDGFGHGGEAEVGLRDVVEEFGALEGRLVVLEIAWLGCFGAAFLGGFGGAGFDVVARP